jgi:hypothetical protein
MWESRALWTACSVHPIKVNTGMTNPFVAIVSEAGEKGWCVRPYCTTCGAHAYRKALRRLAGPLGGPLCDALCQLSPSDLIKLPGWDDALEVAIRDLPIAAQVTSVLSAWLLNVGRFSRFDDVVLYRIVRDLPASHEQRDRWLLAAVPNAVKERDESLIETLLLILRSRCVQFPELIVAAKEIAKSSKQMRRVLRNVGVAGL